MIDPVHQKNGRTSLWNFSNPFNRHERISNRSVPPPGTFLFPPRGPLPTYYPVQEYKAEINTYHLEACHCQPSKPVISHHLASSQYQIPPAPLPFFYPSSPLSCRSAAQPELPLSGALCKEVSPFPCLLLLLHVLLPVPHPIFFPLPFSLPPSHPTLSLRFHSLNPPLFPALSPSALAISQTILFF